MAITVQKNKPTEKGQSFGTRLGGYSDDGSYKFQLTKDFKWGTSTYNYINISGNSWIGLGSATEHIRVNRRDAAVHNAYAKQYTEKGVEMLWVRWEGHGRYGSSYATEFIWEVTITEFGEIQLLIVRRGNSYMDGTWSLTCNGASTTYSSALATGESIVGILNSSNKFDCHQNCSLGFGEPQYLLFEIAGKIYTLSEGEFVEVGDAPVTATMFLENGIEEIDMTIPRTGIFENEIKVLVLSHDELEEGQSPESAFTLKEEAAFEKNQLFRHTHPLDASLPIEKIEYTSLATDGHELLDIPRETLDAEFDYFRVAYSIDNKNWITYKNGAWNPVDLEETHIEQFMTVKEANNLSEEAMAMFNEFIYVCYVYNLTEHEYNSEATQENKQAITSLILTYK